MADRVDFYFRQRVTEAELDLAFEQLEAADRHLAADLGIHGIISGALPAPHEPVADLTIDLEAPARAYDHLGQRVFFGVDQRVDCSVDHNGLPTEVMQPGEARWLGVFLRFDRRLSDPRTDGNSQEVFFRRDEAFELRVRMAPEADEVAAPRVALVESELLVCDVRRRHGQTRIVEADIDLSRRQAFVFASGRAVSVEGGLWRVLSPATPSVQASLDAVDAELDAHFSGQARRHRAADVAFEPGAGLSSHDVQEALRELIAQLTASDTATPGSRRVGARQLAGSPHALAAGRVDDHLERLLGWLNIHLTRPAGAHHASAIEATPHHFIKTRSVQAQLQELVTELGSRNPSLGAAQIGSAAINTSARGLVGGTVRSQLTELLELLNAHARGADHDARYLAAGAKAVDSERLDGLEASELALAGHDHDGRYMRRVYQGAITLEPGQQRDVVTLPDAPQLVTVAYNQLGADRLPQAVTHVVGAHTPQLRCWVSKLDQGGGDKDHRVSVRNAASVALHVIVTAHAGD